MQPRQAWIGQQLDSLRHQQLMLMPPAPSVSVSCPAPEPHQFSDGALHLVQAPALESIEDGGQVTGEAPVLAVLPHARARRVQGRLPRCVLQSCVVTVLQPHRGDALIERPSTSPPYPRTCCTAETAHLINAWQHNELVTSNWHIVEADHLNCTGGAGLCAVADVVLHAASLHQQCRLLVAAGPNHE